MNKASKGFGLIELLIALALSLIVVLGVAQVFIAAKNTYVSQNASANMQEDARFVLSKMIQEIRMVGMFGCQGTINDSSSTGDFSLRTKEPISWDNTSQKLTLVTADVGRSGTPTWTVVSRCGLGSTGSGTSPGADPAYAYPGVREPGEGQMAFPIRRLIYSLKNNQLTMGVGNVLTPTQAVLIDNVSAFNVSFGVEGSTGALSYSSNPSDMSLIRSVRLTLTLTDPNNRVRNQTFNVVAALRNRLP
jgi:type IV pilus assembly protein PilW